MENITETAGAETDLVWEVAGIARVIDRTERQTFHLLATGKLPARKVGKCWVASRTKLINYLVGDMV